MRVADNPAARKPDAVEASLPERLVSDVDHLSLSRLVVEIAWRIDHGQADRVWELFVPDGVLDTSGTALLGHDAIHDWGREIEGKTAHRPSRVSPDPWRCDLGSS